MLSAFNISDKDRYDGVRANLGDLNDAVSGMDKELRAALGAKDVDTAADHIEKAIGHADAASKASGWLMDAADKGRDRYDYLKTTIGKVTDAVSATKGDAASVIRAYGGDYSDLSKGGLLGKLLGRSPETWDIGQDNVFIP